ncbi:ATP-binding protein [Nonomuraea sp. NPDC051941]|uniref:ATP-binding protein n=1 Tax=Nonomuraea sp. NPDC051941 TaxID=3364373 RepID=UPI0037C7D503
MDTRTQHASSAGPNPLIVSSTCQRQSAVEEFPDLAPGLVMSTLRASQVWSGMAWRRAFPGRGDQSAPARRMVGQLLADTGQVDDARWVTAELVSNALRHSRSGRERGFFVVEVLRGIDVARIVVYDLGGGPSPDFSRAPGSVPEAAEHGWGLAGVAELAARTGIAGDAITGHAVWADLALEPVPAEPSEPVNIGEVACPHRAFVGQQGASGDVPDGRLGALRDGVMISASGPGPVSEEGAAGLDPSAGLWEAS